MIVVDRIEGNVAVCETDAGMKKIPLQLIKGKVIDGVLLVQAGEGYRVDVVATYERRQNIKKLAKDLWK